MGKGEGCGASVPADAKQAEPAAELQVVREHLQRIGLRPDAAAARATELLAAGYDEPEQIDRLPEETLRQAGFRPGDLEKVSAFRQRQDPDPPLLATPVEDGSGGATNSPAEEVRCPEECGAVYGERRLASALRPGTEPTEQWLHLEQGCIVLGGANEMLRQLQPQGDATPPAVNFATIFGAARTGKSTLMSLLCGEPGLFKSSPGGKSFTQGIMMANYFPFLEDFSSQDGGERIVSAGGQGRVVIGFVDAEGQGDKGTEHDLKLVSSPLLLSRVVLFNWKGGMQKHKILEELWVMTQVAIKYKDPEAKGKPFYFLAITFQQCKQMEINDGEEDRYAHLFDEEDPGLSEDKEMEIRNKTRRFLIKSFENIKCFLFPSPVIDESAFVSLGFASTSAFPCPPSGRHCYRPFRRISCCNAPVSA